MEVTERDGKVNAQCSQYHPFRRPEVPCDELASYACDDCQRLLCQFHLMLGPRPDHADLCTGCWARRHASQVASMLEPSDTLRADPSAERRLSVAAALCCLRRLGAFIAGLRTPSPKGTGSSRTRR